METIDRIANLIEEQQHLQGVVEACEANLKTAKEKLREMEELTLPQALEDAGLDTGKTKDGFEFSVKENVFASIKEDRKSKAHDWLVEHDAGSLIKNTITITFGKNEMQECLAFIQELDERDNPVDFTRKEAVHASTLKSYIREQLEAGRLTSDEMELFGVSVVKQAKVKKPKNKF